MSVHAQQTRGWSGPFLVTVAELLRMHGVEPRRALAVKQRFGDLHRGLASVVRDAWAFAVGLDGGHGHRDAAVE